MNTDQARATMLQNFGGKHEPENKRYRAKCPKCNSKKPQLLWNDYIPFTFYCLAQGCGYKGSIHTFTSDFTKKSELSEIEKKVWAYRKNSGKNHRLTDDIIKEFDLRLHQYVANNDRIYRAISVFNKEGTPLKKLVNTRWICAYKKKYMPRNNWLNVHNLSKNKNQKIIFFTAGEWDMFSLYKHLKIHSISPVYGENIQRKLSQDQIAELEFVANKFITIVADNDTAGRAYSQKLASALTRYFKVKAIKILFTHTLGVLAGGDIDDFFNQGGSVKRLLEILEETKPYILFDDSTSLQKFESIPERNLSIPEHKDSIIPIDSLKIAWNAFLLPKNKRNLVIEKLVLTELGEDDVNRFVLDRIKKYQNEIDTMTAFCIKKLISEAIVFFNITAKKKNNQNDARLFYYYESGVYKLLTEEKRKNMIQNIMIQTYPKDIFFEQRKIREQILEDIEYELINVKEKIFDQEIGIINFKNGLFDLQKMILLEHSPGHYSTFQLPYEYDENAKTRHFQRTLVDWFETKEDREQFLVMCYYIISGIRSKALFAYFLGSGRNGKGEATQLLVNLIGMERTSSVKLEELKEPHMITTLYGSWLNVSDEVDYGGGNKAMPANALKAVTGQSLMLANPKHKQPFSFVSKAFWIIISNELPTSSDSSIGYHSRFKMFNFKAISQYKMQDHYFENFLKPEIQGIINTIIIKGKKLWQKAGNNFTKTEKDKEIHQEIERKHSVNGFWLDRVQENHEKFDNDEYINDKEIIFETVQSGKNKNLRYIDYIKHYEFYLSYCKENQQRPFSKENFKDHTINFFNRSLNSNVDDMKYLLNIKTLWLSKIDFSLEKHSRRVIEIKQQKIRKNVKTAKTSKNKKIENDKENIILTKKEKENLKNLIENEFG
jgi:phage/plasmid-associated DNA primase